MKLSSRLLLLIPLLVMIPLSFVGYLGYLSQRQALIRKTVEQLSSIADIQEKRVNEILSHYLEEVLLVSRQEQLTESSRAYFFGSKKDRKQIQAVLEDYEKVYHEVERATLYSADGDVVASTDRDELSKNVRDSQYFQQGLTAAAIAEIFKNDQNRILLRLVSPVRADGKTVGVVELVADAAQLLAISEDYAGLGQTGEMLLVKKNSAGDVLFLTPLRFDAGAALSRGVTKDNTNIPSTHAVNGEESVYIRESTIDYRAVPVLAVTRFIDTVQWGVVVKIDRSEALAPVYSVLRTFVAIVFLAMLFVVIVSLFVSRKITKPIEILTTAATELRKGNFGSQVEVTTKDEVGQLAAVFNDMSTRLAELYRDLEIKVADRTRDLEAEKQKLRAKDQELLQAQRVGKFGTFTWDLQTNAVVWSPESFRLYGLEPTPNGAPPPLEEYFAIIHPEDRKAAQLSINEALTTQGEHENFHRVIWKDGSIHWIQVKSKVEFSAEGKPLVLRGTLQDVTKERQVDQTKTEFVSLASHQLRTPLTAINWYTEMLLNGDAGKITEEQRKYLQEVATGSKRMVELVSALLNVSRIELGTFAVDPEPTDLIELLQGVLDELKVLVAEKSIAIVEQHDQISELSVDPKLMRIVYQNLLTNAVKYTPEKGKITILHKLVRDPQVGECVEISVADTGIGIPAEQQDKIFKKLYRASNAQEVDAKGTGLGLYIVKAIIEQARGKVTFVSQEGKGTTFFIKIPKSGMVKNAGSKPLE